MTNAEQGFLLLTSRLGDPNRHPLTTAQLRVLAQRVRACQKEEPLRELNESDIRRLGYGREMAEKIVRLLGDVQLLEYYLRQGKRQGCVPISRVSEVYPIPVRNRLGDDAPGCFWAKGDLSLLEMPAVSLVGSRDIADENLQFAREVGRQAARQGYVLVSGNARGADRAAQEACLRSGGQVISVVADELERCSVRKNILYLSEDGFDLPFSSQRALSRNRIIHCMGLRTFVAQSDCGKGGTWDGTVKNLRSGWSPVYCFQDGSYAAKQLEELGAECILMEELHDFNELKIRFLGLFDQ